MQGVSHLDLSCHSQESLLDVVGALRRRFKEWNAQAVGKFLSQKLRQQLYSQRSIRIEYTFATVYSTTFLSDISLLFPTRSLFTPSVA